MNQAPKAQKVKRKAQALVKFLFGKESCHCPTSLMANGKLNPCANINTHVFFYYNITVFIEQ
ncbi:hypothetical protein RO3G_17457 [Rhizopus delemar RA 99-880]|uniref:Uncharacterized protein n=1 Tax=Rhizopus delemar (strain RA 99-880 / ATCC MYA-4621 / FGSC 9543 / NRRL 43880) TaxID=246409 RepID=I1C7N9_RHIO9|nr:hypothetical protein RO3G_06432 [Rhizopus delemar RA 99-880]EIE84469.1 hypothetical protein RO3G_09179 [Rhizopus delemar RA 99-880]EIE84478.1 hypothetical protein RO3G_09188 [Rhizopus delemar RA 99-880]EIE90079.1 hypothetical protein RO3G_14790 [Rhizopus delemar RA 99-880]EIE90086.1 hypothetical protein RO3G_14797 [Rhizopus delemar RA 99-880]|eukprot:EIE81727.1 hypothetical protein RO3G_06432 [Rhizopus delemar RA 99-880]